MKERVTESAKQSRALKYDTSLRKSNSYQSVNSPLDRILFLQRTIGNKSVERIMPSEATNNTNLRQITQYTHIPVIHRGILESMKRGARIYLRLNDEGAAYARELMEWRFIGVGMDFVRRDGRWSRFMADRPEIQRAMATKLSSIAANFAAAARTSRGTFHDSVTDVRLNELESMRLTLHGCHRIDIDGSYEVSEESGHKVVRFSDISFVWVDRADLHPGTATELDTGERVDDREFTSAGWNYDIRIHFNMPRTSTWRVIGGTASHERGWPPITGAPAAGFRG